MSLLPSSVSSLSENSESISKEKGHVGQEYVVCGWSKYNKEERGTGWVLVGKTSLIEARKPSGALAQGKGQETTITYKGLIRNE